jgi:shikimate kinase
MKKNLVFLSGFMASGKSTIGPILANTLGWNFFDLDKLIEEKEGKKIRDIFQNQGEDYFRTLEKKILKEVSNLNNYIIALGGGTIADTENLELIKKNGLLVYLKSSPEETYKRLRFKRDRPAFLFDDEEPSKEKFLEKINELLEKREKYYSKADVTIDTDKIRIGQTVDKLASLVKKEFDSEANKT